MIDFGNIKCGVSCIILSLVLAFVLAIWLIAMINSPSNTKMLSHGNILGFVVPILLLSGFSLYSMLRNMPSYPLKDNNTFMPTASNVVPVETIQKVNPNHDQRGPISLVSSV